MAITARIAAWCYPCSEPIIPHIQQIERDDTGRWVHADCVDSDPADRPEKRQPCPDCWQVPSASGSCGCDD